MNPDCGSSLDLNYRTLFWILHMHCLHSPLFPDIIFSIFVRSLPAAHKRAVLTPSSLHSLQEPSLKDLSTFALCDDSLPCPLESIPIRLFGPGSLPHWNCCFQVTGEFHIQFSVLTLLYLSAKFLGICQYLLFITLSLPNCWVPSLFWLSS